MQVAWLDSSHYENVLGALIMLVILSLILERALAVVFEWSVWREWLVAKKLRAPIALGVAYVICIWADFDVLSVLFAKENGYSGDFSLGPLITAAVIAGGSKGAILLFQGVLGFGRDAVKARVEARSKPEEQKEKSG